jgi:[acyl-carrier-protein] S-malonyltransferase
VNKVALIFPGTGSQYAGMFRELYKDYSIIRQTFEEADEALGFNLSKLILEDGLAEMGGVAHAQVAIATCSVAGFRVYMQEVGIKPSLSAGHSLGEWSALTCAGALPFSDALRLVWLRGKCMEEATPHGGGLIVAVKGVASQLVEQQQRKAYMQEDNMSAIACYNSPDQVVIAGHRAATEELAKTLEALGGKVIPLTANVPFHTMLMKPAATQLQMELNSYSFQQLEWPVISNVTAWPHLEAPYHMANRLAEQLISPVQWESTTRLLQREGINYTVEIGPNQVLTRIIRQSARNIKAYALDHPTDLASIFRMKDISPSFFDQILAIVVSTRNDNDNAEEYNKGVAEPYQQLLHIQQQFSLEEQATDAQKKLGVELLRQIMMTKKVAEFEQEARLDQLMRG